MTLPPTSPMIELTGLTKRYGSFTAVNAIDLTVPAGELFGFLGPNGAGKTTTLRMIAGILEHAPALVAFCNPTVNAYKRLGPDTMAPYRSNWGYDNRTTFVRIPPERGAGGRIEVRIGDGAGNPYVVIAVILAAALDGLQRQLECPDPSEGWSYTDESRPSLPMTFTDSLDAMKADTFLTGILGEHGSLVIYSMAISVDGITYPEQARTVAMRPASGY